jgi:hypothetical protein
MSTLAVKLPHSPLVDPLPPEARMRLAMHGDFQFREPGETLIDQAKLHRSLIHGVTYKVAWRSLIS